MSDEMSIEEARMIVQSADEAAAALPAARKATLAAMRAEQEAAVVVDDLMPAWWDAVESEGRKSDEEATARRRRGDWAGAERRDARWEKRKRLLGERMVGRGAAVLLKAERELEKAKEGRRCAKRREMVLRRAQENGMGRLERLAEVEAEAAAVAVKQNAEAGIAAWEAARRAGWRGLWMDIGVWVSERGDDGAKEAMAGWGAAVERRLDADERDSAAEEQVAAERKTMSEEWWSGGRLAAARRIVAAADDRAVLRQVAGLSPDADDDSAPVRRRSKGGPKGGM